MLRAAIGFALAAALGGYYVGIPALRGWYRPSESGAAVVLTHGYALGRAYLLPQADILAAAGFGVLT